MHKYFYLTKNHYSDYIKALLLIKKDKDSQANRKIEERARDTRQDTQWPTNICKEVQHFHSHQRKGNPHEIQPDWLKFKRHNILTIGRLWSIEILMHCWQQCKQHKHFGKLFDSTS